MTLKKIKIPRDTITFYNKKNNLLTFVGNQKAVSFKPHFKIALKNFENCLLVSKIPVTKDLARYRSRNILAEQGALVSKIKHKLREAQNSFYIRLKLVGVGYRALLRKPENNKSSYFELKLGYSHRIHCNLPRNLMAFCKKYSELTLRGKSDFQAISQTAAKVRNMKLPDPYKGKGILYVDEKISLKTGKRI